MSESDEAFVVEEILEKKSTSEGEYFLVKWADYADTENSWVSKKNFHGNNLLKAFEATERDRRRVGRRYKM
jgi:hypothetical protein